MLTFYSKINQINYFSKTNSNHGLFFNQSFQWNNYQTSLFVFSKKQEEDYDPWVEAELRFQRNHKFLKTKRAYWRIDEYGRWEDPYMPRWFRRVFIDPDPEAPDYFVLDVFYRIYKLFLYMYKAYQNYKRKMRLLGIALDRKYGIRNWWKVHKEPGIKRRRPKEFDLFDQKGFYFDWKGYDPYSQVGIFEMYYWNIIKPYLTNKPVCWGHLPQARSLFGWDRWNPKMSNHLDPQEIEYLKTLDSQELRKKGFDLTWSLTKPIERRRLMKITTPQMIYKNPKYIHYSPEQKWWLKKSYDLYFPSNHSNHKNNFLYFYEWDPFLYFHVISNVKFYGTPINFLFYLFISLIFMFFFILILFRRIRKDQYKIWNLREQLKNERGYTEDYESLTAYQMMERWTPSIKNSYWLKFWCFSTEYTILVLTFCGLDYFLYKMIYYIVLFYCTFELTCTIFFLLIFFILFCIFFKKWRKDKLSARREHRYYDHPFSGWLCSYFASMCFSQIVKLYAKFSFSREDYWSYEEVWRFEHDRDYESSLGHWFKIMDWINYEFHMDIWSLVVGINLIFIAWYFAVEHEDFFMGWEQEFTKKMYDQQKWVHRNFWNVRHSHLRMMKFKFYKFILRLVLIALIPVYLIFPLLKKIFFYINYSYTKFHNRFFWWKDKKYTFEEIKNQWEKDKKKKKK